MYFLKHGVSVGMKIWILMKYQKSAMDISLGQAVKYFCIQWIPSTVFFNFLVNFEFWMIFIFGLLNYTTIGLKTDNLNQTDFIRVHTFEMAIMDNMDSI